MTVSGYDLDVAAAAALQSGYEQWSAQAAGLSNARLDLSYGPHPRQRLDVFSAGPEAPAIVFFHGGYWKAGSKDARRFPAKPWNALGVSWIAVNYRLTPDHELADCVADTRAAVAWLAAHADTLDLDPANLHLAGNSAGAHLAAMAAAAEWAGAARPTGIRSLCGISGLFDLQPLLHEVANAWLGLNKVSARDLSPQNHMPPPTMPILIGCGGAETAEFKTQSNRYADLCRMAGQSRRPVRKPGFGSFSHYR